jgi:hypothetical protein
MIFAFRPESIVLGLGLVSLGALWTLANLGMLELLPTLRTWWPSTLVVWGLLELLAWFVQRQGGNR